MKKLLILISLFAIFVMANSVEAQVRTLPDVSVTQVETLFSDVITISGGYATLSVDILCTQIGGTTDGNIQVQVRNGAGGNWEEIGEFFSSNFLTINDADSIMTMTAGKVYRVVFNPAPFYEYRFKVIGTASDATDVSFDYLINYIRR